MNAENLIKLIERRPGMFVGEPDLESFQNFVNGYLFNNIEAKRADNIDWAYKNYFDEWVRDYLEKKYSMKFEEKKNYIFYINQVFPGSEEQKINVVLSLSKEFFSEIGRRQYPGDFGNATIITNRAAQGSGFVMTRWEDIFDYFSEEPVSITVKEKENSSEKEYTRILRIRIWNQRKRCISWSVYSEERENLDKLVIRRVKWDMRKDEEWLTKHVKENRAAALKRQPTMEICNIFLLSNQSDPISRLIDSLDSEIKYGFSLHENSNPTWEWRDMEMLRLYNWGQVHLTWCPDRKNEEVERKMKELAAGMDYAIEKADENIFEMNLNYSNLLHEVGV